MDRALNLKTMLTNVPTCFSDGNLAKYQYWRAGLILLIFLFHILALSFPLPLIFGCFSILNHVLLFIIVKKKFWSALKNAVKGFCQAGTGCGLYEFPPTILPPRGGARPCRRDGPGGSIRPSSSKILPWSLGGNCPDSSTISLSPHHG